MGKLRATIEADEVVAEYLEIYNNLFALLISRRICWSNPVIGNRTVGKDSRLEVCSFASTAVKPETCGEFHTRSLNQD